jgi:hypothetical protein
MLVSIPSPEDSNIMAGRDTPMYVGGGPMSGYNSLSAEWDHFQIHDRALQPTEM